MSRFVENLAAGDGSDTMEMSIEIINSNDSMNKGHNGTKWPVGPTTSNNDALQDLKDQQRVVPDVTLNSAAGDGTETTEMSSEIINPNDSMDQGDNTKSPAGRSNNDALQRRAKSNGTKIAKKPRSTERNFGCELCSARFTLRTNKWRHFRTQHPDQYAENKAEKLRISQSKKSFAFLAQEQFKRRIDATCSSSNGDNVTHEDNKNLAGAEASNGEVELQENQNPELSQKPFCCFYCQKSFEHGHMQLPMPSMYPYKCHICKSDFTCRIRCLRHIKAQHAKEFKSLYTKGAIVTDVTTIHKYKWNPDPAAKSRKIICAFCLRYVWSMEHLRRHMCSHSGEKRFECHICRAAFTAKFNLNNHLTKFHKLPPQALPAFNNEKNYRNGNESTVVDMGNISDVVIREHEKVSELRSTHLEMPKENESTLPNQAENHQSIGDPLINSIAISNGK